MVLAKCKAGIPAELLFTFENNILSLSDKVRPVAIQEYLESLYNASTSWPD